MSTETDALHERVAILESEAKNMRQELAANTAITTLIKRDTDALMEFIEACHSIATFAKWTGRVMQWLAPVALAIVSVWAFLKNQKP
ncbi:MAG: hypothetical protein KGI71_03925 [Patescibacteria group bacterium]|nr:hypothetical protein [Patescibacteria group bacterium]